ncbi:AAA family ATPase [Amycolatopsis alba]|uniref:Chromosome segregation protein SMC n=1 Tax=Amycolatopsis alba DSM 44262 TaxID=1125972 RepID=A0A229RDV9_AMYAL|nr:AAA family ATPase [Amycolatopsis alba]OXM44818.1 chromosome segregation protein SMC [Amycolatopsis alba DSM 44262]
MVEQQRLASVEIEDFTSIRSARADLGAMNVLIGANGAGKSNLLQAIALLGSVGDGSLNLFVGLNGGASSLINNSAERQRLTMTLTSPPFTYQVSLTATPNEDMTFENEAISCHRPGKQPWTKSLGQGHRESRLSSPVDDPDLVAACSRVGDLLRGCRVYHFHDSSTDTPARNVTSTADNQTLRPDAGNLAAVLLRLRDSTQPADTAAYRRIIGAIRLIAPFVSDFVLQPDTTGRIQLRWRDQNTDTVYTGHQMSDGTLRFAGLATLLLQPELPALIAIDEPELGLHPVAIGLLADMLTAASTRSEVLIATQSVTLLNQFTAEDVIVTELRDGGTAFARPNTAALRPWLADYSLGELWEKNIIGGHPGSSGSVLDPPRRNT